MSSHRSSFRLPDTLRNWPWSRNVNPHYAQVSAASAAWLESFKVFRPKAQSAFNKCNFGLLASLAYPLATQDQLRAGCDLMNLFFVFDELSDVGDEKTVQELADIIMDALRNPGKTRPHGESVVGVIAQQFWQHAVKIASVSSQRRFIATFDDYCQSVVEQATDRAIGRVHDVDSYLHMRRENIGAKPSFAILELGMDLPDEVFYHPTLVNLSTWAIDMLILGNDICSYNVEQARGDDSHNIVTVVMRQYNTDIQGAMDWIARYHDHLVAQFIDHCGKLPSWGPEIDAQLIRYLDGLGNWVRANDCWSFESQRYFGKEGLKVMASRSVTLLPKVNAQKVETTPKVERPRAFSTSRPMPSMH